MQDTFLVSALNRHYKGCESPTVDTHGETGEMSTERIHTGNEQKTTQCIGRTPETVSTLRKKRRDKEDLSLFTPTVCFSDGLGKAAGDTGKYSPSETTFSIQVKTPSERLGILHVMQRREGKKVEVSEERRETEYVCSLFKVWIDFLWVCRKGCESPTVDTCDGKSEKHADKKRASETNNKHSMVIREER
ncbi:MAG: uncharacterized protein A8A55_2395 [Amphiamblys sp. WSBS2006]|nr:MAG: uncharacterized protein A8A55_2395 [Amphiamblys sp. WSBS2006]